MIFLKVRNSAITAEYVLGSGISNSFWGAFLAQHFKGYFAKVVELLGSGNSHVAARIKYSKVRQNTGVSETLVEL